MGVDVQEVNNNVLKLLENASNRDEFLVGFTAILAQDVTMEYADGTSKTFPNIAKMTSNYNTLANAKGVRFDGLIDTAIDKYMQLITLHYDTEGTFNPSKCEYTIPEDGKYIITIEWRHIELIDSRALFTLLGFGNSEVMDITNPVNEDMSISRVNHLTKGTIVRLNNYIAVNYRGDISTATITITKIGA